MNPGAPYAPAGPNCPVEPAESTAHASPGDPAVPLPPGILLSPGVSGARAGLLIQLGLEIDVELVFQNFKLILRLFKK